MSQEQAQLQLQNALTTTFLANLAFLSEYDNELYHRVDELSQMIEKEEYKEKYALDFIEEQGEFDIYDMVNDKYLYDRKPKKHINKLINEIQFDTKNVIFTLENIYKYKSVKQVPRDLRHKFQTREELSYLVQSDVFDYTDYLKDNLTLDKKRFKKIDKFIFFGTLLGRHIPKISQKVDAKIYLVCERNLEIFRLSLFTVDYTILAKNSGVVFSIMSELKEQRNKINLFLTHNLYDNFLIKFSNTTFNTKEYIELFLQEVLSLQPTTYNYNRILYIFINRVTQYINKYKVLQLNESKKNFDFFEDKKVLFIAAGPSLDEHIQWIKKNQNKFFIVSIGAVFEKLLDYGIKVDMVSTLDEKYEVVATNQFTQKAVDKLKDTIILASVITHSTILERFDRNNLFLYELFTPFHHKNIALSGFSVGEITVELLLYLNVKELYLVGLDLALNQDTGQTHSQGSTSSTDTYNVGDFFEKSFEESKKDFSFRESFVEVKGNMKEKVYTTGVFSVSIQYLNRTLEKKSKDINIYNLSKNGAYFENTIFCEKEQINIQKFDNQIYNIDDFTLKLDSCSFKNLSKKSYEKVKNELDFINEILEKELKEFEKIEDKSFEEFFNRAKDLKGLFQQNENRTNLMDFILENYYQIIIQYLSYYFNDKKLKQEDKKLKVLNKIFVKQLRVFLDDYLEFFYRLK